MGRRYWSQFKPKKHHVSLKRWDKQETIEKKIRESDDSYEDHYKIYWRFALKRKTSKSTDSIPTKKSTQSALIRVPTKNHLNGHLIVIKFKKWGYGTSLPRNIDDSNQEKIVNYKRGPYKDCNEKSQRLLRLSIKNYSFIETKQTKLRTIILWKSSVKWVVDSHHGSKVRLWNITRTKIVESSRKKMYTDLMIKYFEWKSCTKSK